MVTSKRNRVIAGILVLAGGGFASAVYWQVRSVSPSDELDNQIAAGADPSTSTSEGLDPPHPNSHSGAVLLPYVRHTSAAPPPSNVSVQRQVNVARMFDELIASARDQWSANMELALTTFVSARPEFQVYPLGTHVEFRIACRAPGCALQLEVTGVRRGEGAAFADTMRELVASQPWMVQLELVAETADTLLGPTDTFYYVHVYKKVS